MIITIIAAIFVFGVIVAFHEFGHFIMAKAMDMRVDEFSIGFGPALWSKRKGETLYAVRCVPLGGYNRIAGMEPDAPTDDPRLFSAKPVWKRFLVIAAGAIFNFILAIVFYFFILASYGLPQALPGTTIGKVLPDSPAAMAHMEVNDRILTIAGKPVKEWKEISPALKGQTGHIVPITVERNGQVETLTLVPKEEDGRTVIGILEAFTHEPRPIGQAVIQSLTMTWRILEEMGAGLYMMVTHHESGDVAGPLGVAQMAGQVAQSGWINLLLFTALLSLNLGLINLLPIPVLDGGYLVLLILEGIRRKALPPKALAYIQMTGMTLLILLFIYATSNDITRIWAQ
ncbi:MAG: RIP metalloprotease RseP [Veillonellaceae bacterium]|nr:RIP metalloprotease RseP [Veillonellaceae bacterium]